MFSKVSLLTESGEWVDIDKVASKVLAVSDKGIASFKRVNVSTGTITEGSAITGKHCNVSVSDDHNMLCHNSTSKKLTTVVAKEITSKKTLKYGMLHAVHVAGEGKLTDYEKFLIATEADSYVVANKRGIVILQFNFTKVRKVIRLKKLLKKLKYEFKYYKKERIHTFRVYVYESKPTKNFKDYFDISKFTSAYAKAFVYELKYWDCHVSKNVIEYSSINKESSEFVRVSAIMAGYRTTMNHAVDNRSDKYSDLFRIGILVNKATTGNGVLTTKPLTKPVKGFSVDYRVLARSEDGAVFVI